MTYYTNSTSMIADLRRATSTSPTRCRSTPSARSRGTRASTLQSVPSSEVTNITINSNPLKPKNRELLNPKVREALEYATDRNSIVKVIYAGHARPWANMLSLQSGSFWLNPAIKPLPFDIAKANQILDSLGYKRGLGRDPGGAGDDGQVRPARAPDGVRRDRARQPRLQRRPPVPDHRQRLGARSGSSCTRSPAATAARPTALETAGKYTKFDFATWDWAEYVDPDAQLSYMTRAQWYSWSDTGYNNPALRQAVPAAGDADQPQAAAGAGVEDGGGGRPRPALHPARRRGHGDGQRQEWTGFYPDLNGYCKCYYTSPHKTG